MNGNKTWDDYDNTNKMRAPTRAIPKPSAVRMGNMQRPKMKERMMRSAAPVNPFSPKGSQRKQLRQ